MRASTLTGTDQPVLLPNLFVNVHNYGPYRVRSRSQRQPGRRVALGRDIVYAIVWKKSAESAHVEGEGAN